MGKKLYTKIWEKTLPDILDLLEFFPAHSVKQLDASDFNAAGNRKKYGFRLEIQNGQIINNIKGSAVARDLAEVFLSNSRARQYAMGKHIVITMSQHFTLAINLLSTNCDYKHTF